MAVLNNNTLAGSSGQTTGAGGYQIERSLRFNSADSAYLNRTPASAGNRKTWTWAGWVKRTSTDYSRVFSTANSGNTEGFYFEFQGDSALTIYDYSSPTVQWQKTTTQVFRDFSAWFHVVLTFDSTQVTASDRFKLYINGTIVTQFSTSSDPSLNFDSYCNAARLHAIGRTGAAAVAYFNGYLADIHFIDGQALDPTSFGEFDTNGVWQPIDASGLTYGTNGFHLPFSDNSTAAALGTDTSGNGNDWTPNNLQVSAGSVYSNNISASVGGYQSGYAPTNLFDGSTSTFLQDTASYQTQTVTITFNPALTVNTKLEVYAFLNSNQYDAREVSVNGGAYYNPNVYGSNQWWDLTAQSATTGFSTGTLNSITFRSRWFLGGAAFTIASAIRVDNTILTDGGAYDVDSLVDSPTNGSQEDTGVGNEVVGNYATLNPLNSTSNTTLSNGNLDLSSGDNWGSCMSTVGFTGGKVYYETTVTASNYSYIGVSLATHLPTNYPSQNGSWALVNDGTCYYDQLGSGAITVSTGTSVPAGAVVGTAIDADNGKIWWSVNGTWIGSGSPDPATGTNAIFSNIPTDEALVACLDVYGNSASVNFGQRPFAYTAPSGFKTLCTTNLAEPTIADGSTAFEVITYQGNGTTQTLPNTDPTTSPQEPLNFSPDFVWIKERNGTNFHMLFDTVRGANVRLNSNSTNPDFTETTALTSFNSTGFSIGADGQTNVSNKTYVAWTWDAGSSTVTDPNGSITSQVRANPSAGFSIVTYTGVGSNGTVGHGLGAAPSFYIVKARTTTAANSWRVYHSAVGNTKQLFLESTSAEITNPNAWNNTSPTSTVFSVGNSANESSGNYVAYCFAPVDGYSSFGSYTGNGSADGPFVFTGMRPRWILLKSASIGNESWIIIDTARSTYNVVDAFLRADNSGAEFSSSLRYVDILSNGFKLRASGTEVNGSGGTYVYAAFAEHPFATSRAR